MKVLFHPLYGPCTFVFRWKKYPQYICVRIKAGYLFTELESDFQPKPPPKKP